MKRLSFSIILILLIIAASDMPQARVTGLCSNCHTMHSSQGGPAPSEWTDKGWTPGTTIKSLLVGSCVGCHSSSDSSTYYTDPSGCKVPVVLYTGGDAPTSYLAGGNFYWVAQAGGDAKGHNVLGITSTDSLSEAPGNPYDCSNSCHVTLAVAQTADSDLGSGCQGCHLAPAHHADDAGPVVDNTPGGEGWYRFLSGHMSGSGLGVAGIEDPDWQATKGTGDHNEYLGWSGDKENIAGFYNLGNTMTAFCCGCHGNFHEEQDSSGSWLRHPSDAVILNSGEYRYAFGAGGTGTGIYDPLVPVARPSLSGWTEPSSSVTLGTSGDMVMCLSCHRPHGSPYYKMIRWNYKSTTLSDALYGCSKCHTSKN